jgi:hypothetical protein
LEPSRVAAACLRAVDEWNVLAAELGLALIQKLTASRHSKLAARLKDTGGLDGWRAALTKIRESPGLQGENNRRWRCDFDWLVSESNFTKVMEGKYDDWGTAPANGASLGARSGRKGDTFSDVLAGLAEAARRAGDD